MKVVGIDIGSYSIKIAELTPTSSGGTITNYAEFKLTGDPNSDRRLEIIDTLRNYVAGYNHDETHFCVGLQQSYVTHRKVEFPFKERYNIQRSIPFELEENIPLSLDNAIVDAKILSYEGNITHVLASATSHQHVQEMIDLCNDSGFEPYLISANSLAYANIFEDWINPPIEKPAVKDFDEEATVIRPQRDAGVLIQVGHTTTLLLVYSNKELCAIRSFNWGTRNIAKTLSKKYDLPPKEAQKELETKGFILLQDSGATKDQIVFSNTIKESIDPFAHNLKLTFVEIESKHDVEIKKCSVTGGASNIKNIGAFLTQKLEFTTNPLELKPKYIDSTTPEFSNITGGIALGLAIEGLKKPRNPASNFLQGPFAKQNKKFEQLWNKWNYAVKVASASFLVIVAFSCTRDDLTLQMSDDAYTNLTTQARKIIPNAKRTGIIRQTKAYIKRQRSKEKNAKIVGQLSQINSALDIIKEISNVVPSNKSIGLDIRSLKIQGEDVQIAGLLDKNDPVSKFEEALKRISSNGKVKRESARIKSNNVKRAFAYSFKVKRTKGGS